MAVVADMGFSAPPCPAKPAVCSFGPRFALVFRSKPALLKTLVFRLRPLSSSPLRPLLRPQQKKKRSPSKAAAMIAPIAMPAEAPFERWLLVLLSLIIAAEDDSAAAVATAVMNCVTTAPLTVICCSTAEVEVDKEEDEEVEEAT